MKNNTTISNFSRELGVDRHALAVKVEQLGIKPYGRVKEGKAAGSAAYRIRDLVKAHSGGDQAAERLRKTREEADRLSIQNVRSRGELIEVDAVKALARAFHHALVRTIIAMPLTDEEKDRCLDEIQPLRDMDWGRES